MNLRKYAVFCALFLALTLSHSASAAPKQPNPESRFFVKSQSPLWRNSFGARHTFPDGFSANLSDWHLRVARALNIDVQPIGQLFILEKSTQERALPDASIPWGVGAMYDLPSLATRPVGGKGVTVAVIDTGIAQHPDLDRRVTTCKDFTIARGASSTCLDTNGHGTHIAGVIAADGGEDGFGIFGVAPETSLAIYKACSQDGECWVDDVAAAIRAGVDDGAHIIVVSMGADSAHSILASAVKYALDKGVLVIAAAGNDGPYAGSIDTPARLPGVLAVGALDAQGATPEWSSRGVNSRSLLGVLEDGDIAFAAPGVRVQGPWLTSAYAELSGTSVAAPHVAGVAAKVWNTTVKNPAYYVREVLEKIARDQGPEGEDNASGLGTPVMSQ
ncbi:MAG: S8 family serine peptidase [Patescibacteria group bacterium]